MFYGAKELLWDSKSKKPKFDPLAVTAVTYLLTISLIWHKEAWFSIPIMPVVFAITAIGA